MRRRGNGIAARGRMHTSWPLPCKSAHEHDPPPHGNRVLRSHLESALRRASASLSPQIRPVVENALSDRQLLRNLEYVRVLDEEDARFKQAPPNFRNSALGGDVTDALNLARELAVRNAGTLARDRYQRNLDELNEHLRDAAKIIIDITAARTHLGYRPVPTSFRGAAAW